MVVLGTEPTSELVVACIENFQIHKFSEFLGQLSCEKEYTNSKYEALRPGTTKRTVEPAESHLELF